MVQTLVLRARISVLWLFMGIAELGLLLLNLYSPTGIQQVIAGKIGVMGLSPQFSLIGALLLLVPLIMAFLSLTLNDSITRLTNLILGTVFAFFQFAGLAFALSPQATPSPDLTLMQAAAFVAPALIIWYSYRWSKEKQLVKTTTPSLSR